MYRTPYCIEGGTAPCRKTREKGLACCCFQHYHDYTTRLFPTLTAAFACDPLQRVSRTSGVRELAGGESPRPADPTHWVVMLYIPS